MAIGLIVREAFGDYAPGQQIKDPAQVERILAGAERRHVLRVEFPPPAAAEPAAPAIEHEGE